MIRFGVPFPVKEHSNKLLKSYKGITLYYHFSFNKLHKIYVRVMVNVPRGGQYVTAKSVDRTLVAAHEICVSQPPGSVRIASKLTSMSSILQCLSLMGHLLYYIGWKICL